MTYVWDQPFAEIKTNSTFHFHSCNLWLTQQLHQHRTHGHTHTHTHTHTCRRTSTPSPGLGLRAPLAARAARWGEVKGAADELQRWADLFELVSWIRWLMMSWLATCPNVCTFVHMSRQASQLFTHLYKWNVNVTIYIHISLGAGNGMRQQVMGFSCIRLGEFCSAVYPLCRVTPAWMEWTFLNGLLSSFWGFLHLFRRRPDKGDVMLLSVF